MQSITLTRLSSTWSWRNICDGATCTTRRCASTSLEIRLKNPSTTCFQVKQATRSRRVSCVVLPRPFCGANDKPKPTWFWGPNQETVIVILRPKLPNRSCRFWGPNRENRATGFEAKQRKSSPLILRPNRRKPSEWFWRQTTHKPSTLVLRLNHETCDSHLHVHDADRTQRHPTSRSPGHRVPDLCDHSRSSAPGLRLLPRSSSLHAMSHLPPAHHKTSKHDSPMKQKIKAK
jgi:hypothetical protein